MSEPLIIAIPSKGRLKEQVEAWLADCGLDLVVSGGARGYLASLKGLPGAQVRLLSAADIADALGAGEAHFGITGEDLLRERGDLESRVLLLRALGFGRADLVVAAPKSFFARHGVVDYRITESGGATEGAPAAGAAELVVDITTTGATLAANGLKVLSDGLILKSQAQLTASQRAAWNGDQLALAERLLRAVEARAAALTSATLVWPAAGTGAEAKAVDRLTAAGASRRPNGLLIEAGRAGEAAAALTAAGLGPVTVSQPDFVFEVDCPPFAALKHRVL